MHLKRRRLLIAAAVLPAGCALSPPAPVGAPPAANDPRVPRSGERWHYARANAYNRLDDGELIVEMRTEPGRRIFDWRAADGTSMGTEIRDADGGLLQDPAYGRPEPRFETALPLVPMPPAPRPAEITRTRYRIPHDSQAYHWSDWRRIPGWEPVTVPAGRFVCLRIERLIRFEHPDFTRLDPTRFDTIWYSPAHGRWIRREWRGHYYLADDRGRTRIDEDWRIWEMTAHEPAPVSGG